MLHTCVGKLDVMSTVQKSLELNAALVATSVCQCHSQAPFGRASPAASRAAPGEALPNVCFVTGFTCEAGSEAIGGLHRQGEAMKSWLHAAYTSI